MAYSTPKTDWDEDYTPGPEDMNRIEGNAKHLKDEDATINGTKTFTQAIVVPAINTGFGNVEVGQNLRTSDNVTFATVNTGHGDNELYDMDQDVKTTDNVTHNNITADGIFKPRASAVENNIAVSAGATYVFPRGVHVVAQAQFYIEAYIASSWRTVSTDGGGTFFSDGTNVRARNVISADTLRFLTF